MSHFNVHRLLTASAVFATLVAGPEALFTRAQGQNPDLSAAEAPQPPHSELNQGFQPSLEDIGDALMVHQRYQAALESYGKVTPASSKLQNKMGIAHQMMFNNADAERCYKAALKLDSQNAHALNNLGSLYFSLKRFSDAEHMYRRALKLEPGSAVLEINLGTDLVAEHRYDEGWQHYQAALTVDPHALENTSTIQIGNPGRAMDRGAVNYYMARGCVSAGLMDRAIEHLRKALMQGFTTASKLETDNEFAALRDNPAFQSLLASQRNP
jgi:tetratricopeptide (TPR) repeat protein